MKNILLNDIIVGMMVETGHLHDPRIKPDLHFSIVLQRISKDIRQDVADLLRPFKDTLEILRIGLSSIESSTYQNYGAGPEVYAKVIESMEANGMQSSCALFAQMFGFTYQKGGHHA